MVASSPMPQRLAFTTAQAIGEACFNLCGEIGQQILAKQ